MSGSDPVDHVADAEMSEIETMANHAMMAAAGMDKRDRSAIETSAQAARAAPRTLPPLGHIAVALHHETCTEKRARHNTDRVSCTTTQPSQHALAAARAAHTYAFLSGSVPPGQWMAVSLHQNTAFGTAKRLNIQLPRKPTPSPMSATSSHEEQPAAQPMARQTQGPKFLDLYVEEKKDQSAICLVPRNLQDYLVSFQGSTDALSVLAAHHHACPRSATPHHYAHPAMLGPRTSQAAGPGVPERFGRLDGNRSPTTLP